MWDSEINTAPEYLAKKMGIADEQTKYLDTNAIGVIYAKNFTLVYDKTHLVTEREYKCDLYLTVFGKVVSNKSADFYVEDEKTVIIDLAGNFVKRKDEWSDPLAMTQSFSIWDLSDETAINDLMRMLKGETDALKLEYHIPIEGHAPEEKVLDKLWEMHVLVDPVAKEMYVCTEANAKALQDKEVYPDMVYVDTLDEVDEIYTALSIIAKSFK
jgi:hypothetical protein